MSTEFAENFPYAVIFLKAYQLPLTSLPESHNRWQSGSPRLTSVATHLVLALSLFPFLYAKTAYILTSINPKDLLKVRNFVH